MGFMDNVRLASIFGTGSSLIPQAPPLPQSPWGSPTDEYVNRIVPLEHNIKVGDEQRADARAINAKVADRIAQRNSKDNSIPMPIIREAISPLDKAKLDQSQQKIDQGDKKIDSLNDRSGNILDFKKSAQGDNLAFKYSKQDTDSAIRQQRADAYEYRLKNPNDILLKPNGGNYQFVNPQTHKMTDTGIATGTMSKEDELHLTGQNTLDAIGARSSGASDLETQRQSGRMAIQEFKQNNKNFIFKDMPGGNVMAFDPTDPSRVIDTGVHSGRLTDRDKIELGITGRSNLEDQKQSGRIDLANTRNNAKQLSPAQLNIQHNNNAKEYLALHPEASGFITIDDKGNATVKPGADPTIFNAVYGQKAKDIELPKDDDPLGLLKKDDNQDDDQSNESDNSGDE